MGPDDPFALPALVLACAALAAWDRAFGLPGWLLYVLTGDGGGPD